MSKMPLNLTRTSLLVTLRCTLKCKLCTAYSPYYVNPPFYSINKLTNSVIKYFEIVNTVGNFTISGGEPQMHTQLPEIVEFFIKTYIDRVETLELITNGTIIPNQRLLKSLSLSNKTKVLIDDYGAELSTKIPEIVEGFNAFGIRHSVRKYNKEEAYCGGWIDYGNLTQKWYVEETVKSIFAKCIIPQKLGFCFTIVDGNLFPCHVCRRCWELGIILEAQSEHIDLFDNTISIEEKRAKLLYIADIQKLPYLLACKYCDGFCDDSKRYIPAEQL